MSMIYLVITTIFNDNLLLYKPTILNAA